MVQGAGDEEFTPDADDGSSAPRFSLRGAGKKRKTYFDDASDNDLSDGSKAKQKAAAAAATAAGGGVAGAAPALGVSGAAVPIRAPGT